MNFIEQIFGVSPDGGSGELEFLLVVLPLLGFAAWRVWREPRRAPMPGLAHALRQTSAAPRSSPHCCLANYIPYLLVLLRGRECPRSSPRSSPGGYSGRINRWPTADEGVGRGPGARPQKTI